SALILAVLVTGIVASLAVGIAQAFMLDVARIENRQAGMLAQQYLLAAEDMAVLVLLQDQAQSTADHLLEDWARVLPALPVEQGQGQVPGMVELRIEDAQGRLNLNSLAERKPGIADIGLPLEQRFTLAQQLFIQLLQGFESPALSEAQAMALTEALIDWIDEDDEVLGFGGAESLYYINDQPSQAAPNRPLQSLGELAALRHMRPELLKQLQALVVVLPEPTALNLNTALPPLLDSLADIAASGPGLVPLLQARQAQQPFSSLEELADLPELAKLQHSSGEALPLAVASHYFLLQARVMQGSTERSLESLLWRGENELRVLTRRFGSAWEHSMPWQ
ncbi:MAG TPA: type II secretion system minor pseudopilin GspK, partial [Pseudomonadaceae bacterium]|nr:type II secretion system minor pseudopilin GspK [Pseudomonadaceae bacterium]